MKSTVKLSGEERRAAIIQAVRRVFAEKGFHGTTTRELAEEAGVSEALLFKHFPNKEALFSAMQQSCCNEQAHERFERLKALEPSASTLVLLVHFLVSRIVNGCGAGGAEKACANSSENTSLFRTRKAYRRTTRFNSVAWRSGATAAVAVITPNTTA